MAPGLARITPELPSEADYSPAERLVIPKLIGGLSLKGKIVKLIAIASSLAALIAVGSASMKIG